MGWSDLGVLVLGLCCAAPVVWGQGYGVSSQTLYCDFEDSSICSFTQSSSDDFNWTRHRGSTSSSNTGPAYDHTFVGTLSRTGHYMYIEASVRTAGDNASLISPSQSPTTGACLQFWYHMYGVNMGTLRVYKRQAGQITSTLFTKTGNQGNFWNQARIVMSQSSSSWQLDFQGIRGTDFQSDISIDDVSIIPGPCGGCTFQDGTCGWINDGREDFNWLRGIGPRSGVFTHPTIDHTRADPTGAYMYMRSSLRGKTGGKGWLVSPTFLAFNKPESRCFSFWFHMYRVGNGTLNVYVVDTADTNQALLWSQSGNKGMHWVHTKMPIPVQSQDYKIRFEGVRGPDGTDEIAIDDISLTPSSQCEYTHCSPGKYGSQCTSSCRSTTCRNNQCDRSSGLCTECPHNFVGNTCSDCVIGKGGTDCSSSCLSSNCLNNQCSKATKLCIACPDNFIGDLCSDCAPGTFGIGCSSSCLSSNCLNNECNATTRLCDACPDYFEGDLCNDCVAGSYGSDCSSRCLSSTCANNQCNRTTGLCDVCLDNLDGGLCSALPSSYDWTLTIAGAAAGVGVLVIICVIACICCLRRSRAKWEETEATAPPIPLSEMEPAPELRSPPSRAAEGAGAEADDPDSVYEKIRISCIGPENNTYSEFPPQRAEATEPESLYVNVGFS